MLCTCLLGYDVGVYVESGEENISHMLATTPANGRYHTGTRYYSTRTQQYDIDTTYKKLVKAIDL